MGLSASQARFLQLTARKSNVEYEAQQINFQRLQLSNQLDQATTLYQNQTTNRKLTFSFMGAEKQTVDVTYNNYKNFMNQQQEGLSSSSQKLFLVSSSGNKIIVANEKDREAIIQANNKTITKTITPKEGSEEEATTETSTAPMFDESDFMIVEGLEDADMFQEAIKSGEYYFATYNDKFDGVNETKKFNTEGWETIGGGAITEEYDKSDDAAAESEYKKVQTKIQRVDKMLEMKLDELETERNAIQTEIDSVSKVIEDNIESSFKAFS